MIPEEKPKRTKRQTRYKNAKVEAENSIVAVVPMNDNQRDYINAVNAYNQVIVCGYSGTGKTYIAATIAANMYANKQTDKIILTRPNVSVGKDLGYFPGDLNEKFAPWAAPVLEVLNQQLGKGVVDTGIKNGNIEMAPLSTMRGRSFKDAFIIGDEMQNSTPSQMKMLMTRLGKGSQMVITGDTRQSDRMVGNGLVDFKRQYENYFNAEYVKFIELGKMDIQRHPAVAEVLGIYGE